MKRILLAILLIAMICTMFAGVPAYAAANADGTDYVTNLDFQYQKALQFMKTERTDEYAIDNYKMHDLDEWRQGYPDMAKVVDEVTAGITDDYQKAKAIAEWVRQNVYYTFTFDDADEYKAKGLPDWRYGKCYVFSATTQMLLNLAGLPAKRVTGSANGLGGWDGHAWDEVYVDNKWVFVDATFGQFDLPVTDWSKDHIVGIEPVFNDERAWNGSLYFSDSQSDQTLKEIKTFPLNGLVTSTYGFDAKCLYLDRDCTKPFTLNTLKVNARHNTIYVKTASVVYYTQLDNVYKSLKPYVIKTEGTTQLNGETVPEGSKLTAPKAPTKAGYTFIGWYVLGSKPEQKWNFETDTMKESIQLVARFQKGTPSYTVTFNSQGGTAVKALSVKANSTLTKPATPTKKGYKFVNWYKDSSCKTVWNFATNKITANTVIYAGWKRV